MNEQERALLVKVAKAVMRMSGGDGLPYQDYNEIQRLLSMVTPVGAPTERQPVSVTASDHTMPISQQGGGAL